MSSKHSPKRVTLGMIRDKSITKSVPIFRYHASDDDLEELYLSTDDEKQQHSSESETPESPKCSPSKNTRSCKNKEESEEGSEDIADRRSVHVDSSVSTEGTPPSDPWKVLSDFRGKITKTFEEKLSEMKNDRKKRKNRSRENSSVSDSEDFGDVTPTEESGPSDGFPRETVSTGSGRFVGFSQIKTGLKTKNSEEDSVESGVEAAELSTDSFHNVKENTVTKDAEVMASGNSHLDFLNPIQKITERSVIHNVKSTNHDAYTSDAIILQLKNQVFYKFVRQLCILIVIHLCFYYVIPLPFIDYLLGLTTGVFIAISLQNAVIEIKNILSKPPKESTKDRPISVVEIPAAEEHAVVEKFEGWLNELPYPYDPDNYHVARTRSVFFRLEGDMLHVMETKLRIPKRAIWDEPKHKLKFTRRRTYNMAGAKVHLLPEGLIKRRRWSKKYPICLSFKEEALLENVLLKEASEELRPVVELGNDKTTIEEEGEEEETDEELRCKTPKYVFEDCLESNDDTEEVDHGNSYYKLFIFARADRQKEDWYRRLISATNLTRKKNSVSSLNDASISLSFLLMQQSNDESKSPESQYTNADGSSDLAFNGYMSRYLDASVESSLNYINDSSWVNCLIGRILFDVHKCRNTINLIQDKIQKKLSNIKLPYFMESLLVTEITIGQGAPVFDNVTKAFIDERGLWLDLDVTYKGCLTMTVETKLNLMKLTRAGSVSGNSSDTLGFDKPKPARSPIFDSDVEDSPETSTEDEDSAAITLPNTSKELTPSQSSGRKLLNMVDKLAASKYFQHATELSYIRRALEGVSNTEIRLMVNVSGIEGRLSLNIPPPPSDRLWYGFKPVPKVSLTVKPVLGERTVNIVYVTKWIETKLLREFEKVVVLPNMDDLIIPLCPNYPYVE